MKIGDRLLLPIQLQFRKYLEILERQLCMIESIVQMALFIGSLLDKIRFTDRKLDEDLANVQDAGKRLDPP